MKLRIDGKEATYVAKICRRSRPQIGRSAEKRARSL